MNETTRQLVLLIGIMSILVAGLVVVNSVNSTESPGEPDMSGVNDSIEENRTGLIGQSIEGWEQLWKDMQAAVSIIPGIGDSQEDNQTES